MDGVDYAVLMSTGAISTNEARELALAWAAMHVRQDVDIDVTNLDSLCRQSVRAYPTRPTTAHVPPRPMPAPAPQPLARQCAGCGAPLNTSALCSYCKSVNPWSTYRA